MTDTPPAPGHDEIIVTDPDGWQVCHSRGHARLGVLAEVVVTFGDLGTRWQPDAVFPDCWGRSYPMCQECWQAVREVAQARRPALAITGPATAPGSRAAGRRAPAPLAARAMTTDTRPASRPQPRREPRRVRR